MTADPKALFELLPAVHRIRDARIAQEAGIARGPLEELIAVMAEQFAVAAESLEQLHDDLFIETCAEWVVPYIGDLIGYESLHSVVPAVASPRAEVAHTIALRRRKGTALVLEQLARDVTGWDAKAVEYFQRLCWTQHMNHFRPQTVASPDMRQSLALEWIGTPFETACRTVDVRRIETRAGRHNMPNVGLHLWRIRAYPHRESPAIRVAARRYRVSPLNHDIALYNRPLAEDDITHPAEPDNVPLPLSRRRLSQNLARHYGVRPTAGADIDNPAPALVLVVDGTTVERDQVWICNLADDGATWNHTPPPDGLYAIDPVLGRVALPGDAADPADVRLDWQEGFSADVGGGEYERGETLPEPPATTAVALVPDDHATIDAALTAIAGNGVVEITDSSRYVATLTIDVAPEGSVEIRASNGRRPILDLGGLIVRGGENATCTLNGLLIAGAPLIVPDDGTNVLARLSLVHTTLVPGITLGVDGSPTQPAQHSLEIAIEGVEGSVERSILGGVRAHPRSSFSATDSIVDATAPDGVAFAATDAEGPGAMLTLDACTVIGKVHAAVMELVSNSILLATLAEADTWAVPVRAQRKQTGCVRFTWLPLASIVPQRFQCHPVAGPDSIAPHFSSRRYGTPAYCQLARSTPTAIRTGADNGSEMGVLHHLYGAQRETNLRIRLGEYLRVGLSAGIFLES
ncbi:MAG TPA: hypothetical protein VMQ65_02920 [Candidatus Limnocylindria bacterium]|nr:hypothetical protein [Candidatus Limnocylindria bacterium]